MSYVLPFVVVVGVMFATLLGTFALFRAFYVKVDQGMALIVNDMSATPKVRFTSSIVLPVVHRAERMPIRLVTLRVDRRGTEGLLCRDGRRADVTVAFSLRVNAAPADVLRAARAVGASRASDRGAVGDLFTPRFCEALDTAGTRFELAELFANREAFRDEIVKHIGADLNGYVLENVAIEFLVQTSQPLLDSNILSR